MDNRKKLESIYSAGERTGLIINMTFQTAAEKFKKGKPKLKAEKHSAAVVFLMHENTIREGSPGVAKSRSRKRNVSGLTPEPVKGR